MSTQAMAMANDSSTVTSSFPEFIIFTTKVSIHRRSVDCDYIFEIDTPGIDGIYIGTMRGVQLPIRLYHEIGFELLTPLDQIDPVVIACGLVDYRTMDRYKINPYGYNSYRMIKVSEVPFLINWFWLSDTLKQKYFIG